MVTVDSLTQLASQHFASPIGLAALAGLIPLIIFYLVRPQPEEQIMPSMMFFMADKDSGTVSQAIDRLMSNLLLILHILLLAGLAAAIAQPMMSGLERPENAVVIFDRSASMQDDLDSAKQFARSNLGNENTIIVADENVNVALEGVSAGQARSYINGLQIRDVRTDIQAGVETASGYEGDVFIASDMAQTVNSDSAVYTADGLQNDRAVTVMDSNQENKWGIVEVNPARGNSTIEIENFMDAEQTITLNVNGEAQTVEIDGEEAELVTIDTPPGQTTASLEEDPVTADNTAYISIPGEGEMSITYIADDENRFFEEAVNAIPGTSFEYRRPPIEGTVEADIYVVGKTNRILKRTIENLDTQVRNGKSMVLFGQAGFDEHGFQSAPASLGPRLNTTVEIREPLRTTITTEIYETTNITGESLSDPAGAIVRRDYGQGEVLLYNIQDEDFHYDFLYPVFWKNVFRDVSDTPSIEETNLRTGTEIIGSEITAPNGQTFNEPITAYQVGFYETPSRTYAVNMESSEESGSEPVEFVSEPRLSENSKQDIQHFAAILLAIIVVMEMVYLMWLGDI